MQLAYSVIVDWQSPPLARVHTGRRKIEIDQLNNGTSVSEINRDKPTNDGYLFFCYLFFGLRKFLIDKSNKLILLYDFLFAERQWAPLCAISSRTTSSSRRVPSRSDAHRLQQRSRRLAVQIRRHRSAANGIHLKQRNSSRVYWRYNIIIIRAK